MFNNNSYAYLDANNNLHLSNDKPTEANIERAWRLDPLAPDACGLVEMMVEALVAGASDDSINQAMEETGLILANTDLNHFLTEYEPFLNKAALKSMGYDYFWKIAKKNDCLFAGEGKTPIHAIADYIRQYISPDSIDPVAAARNFLFSVDNRSPLEAANDFLFSKRNN